MTADFNGKGRDLLEQLSTLLSNAGFVGPCTQPGVATASRTSDRTYLVWTDFCLRQGRDAC